MGCGVEKLHVSSPQTEGTHTHTHTHAQTARSLLCELYD